MRKIVCTGQTYDPNPITPSEPAFEHVPREHMAAARRLWRAAFGEPDCAEDFAEYMRYRKAMEMAARLKREVPC